MSTPHHRNVGPPQDRTPLFEAVAACDTLGERAERVVAVLHQIGGADLQAVDACKKRAAHAAS